MNFSSLMTLTEAATGFSGGYCTDELEGLTLEEAASMYPVSLIESTVQLMDSRSTLNESLVESAVNAATYGSNPNFGPIVEMSFEDIKKKVAAIFDKIIKFLKSIISKIGLQINKLRMSGHQLYVKYKDSDYLKNKKWKDLTYEGYKIMESKGADIFTAARGYEANANDLIAAALEKGSTTVGDVKMVVNPEQFAEAVIKTTSVNSESNEEKEIVKAIDAITGVSTNDRVLAIVKKLTNYTDLSSSDWKNSLNKKIYGEKVEIRYGSNGFTLGNISDILKDEADYDAIKSEYEKILTAVNNDKKTMQNVIDEAQREIDSLDRDNEGDKNKGAINAKNLLIRYCNAYMTAYSDAESAIGTVKNIKLDYIKTRSKQAKEMFVAMMSYKEPKSENSSAIGFEDFDETLVECYMA